MTDSAELFAEYKKLRAQQNELMGVRNEARAKMQKNSTRMSEIQLMFKVAEFQAKNNIVITPEGIKTAEAVQSPA